MAPALVVQIEQDSGSQICGLFDGSQIVLYRRARNVWGMEVSCGDLATNLAHELGHALGLRNASGVERCWDHIMVSRTQRRPGRRRVQPEECAVVDAIWSTSFEEPWRRPGKFEGNPKAPRTTFPLSPGDSKNLYKERRP